MLTKQGYGDDPDSRYDLYCMCPYSELLAFFDLGYWYSYQVSILGVGPIWMGDNEKAKHRLAKELKNGSFFAFGMSEKDPGADLYSNACVITPQEDGTYIANGNKYYIGNAHIASMVSTLGKNSQTGEWAFWVVDSKHRNYDYVKDIDITGFTLARLGEYEMIDYPLTEDDIIKTGDGAFANGLSTVNIGKFQCGWASFGIAAHALYEAVTHANRRVLHGKPVTNYPHIRAFLSESFCRANAAKLYGLRARDYFRMLSDNDRRYLLFNPIIKMKACREGGEVVRMLMDVVCAKGYENENYLSSANNNMDMLARLEGTAHVNMALVLKFLTNYFKGEKEYPEIGIVDDIKDDSNVFEQRLGGLAKVEFPDYKKAYKDVQLPNAQLFLSQVDLFKELMFSEPPAEELLKNMDHMLAYGEMFTLIVYAQLILESAKLNDVEDELIEQIFAIFIRDMGKHALQQLNQQENTQSQNEFLWKIIKVMPPIDKQRDFNFWKEYVQVLDGAYVMPGAVIGHEAPPTRNLFKNKK